MGKRQLIAFFIALLMFSLLSLLYSSRVIADLKQLYQDPPATLGAELILRPQTAATSVAAQTDLATIQEAVSQRLGHLYLAGTYDERMYEELRLRAQIFEVLTGGDLVTDDSEGYDDQNHPEGRDTGVRFVPLPSSMVSDLRVNLHIWSESNNLSGRGVEPYSTAFFS